MTLNQPVSEPKPLASTPGAHLPGAARSVVCYFCRSKFAVPARAMSLSCPWCYRGVKIGDLLIDRDYFTQSLQTCGCIVITRKGRLVASSIESSMGIEINGVIEGHIRSHAPVTIGPRGILRGSLSAPSIILLPGGIVDNAFLHIGPDAPSISHHLWADRAPNPRSSSATAKIQSDNQAALPPKPRFRLSLGR